MLVKKKEVCVCVCACVSVCVCVCVCVGACVCVCVLPSISRLILLDVWAHACSSAALTRPPQRKSF